MTFQNLTNQYDNAARDWTAKLDRSGYLAAYRAFAGHGLRGQRKMKRVCDIGTGCGGLASAFVAAWGPPASLLLVDPSPQMLARAGDTLRDLGRRVSLHCKDIDGFEPGQPMDVVLSAHVIEHCSDPALALARLWSFVAPGGALLLVVSRPHWCQWLIWLRWRHRWFSDRTLRAMASGARMPDPEVYAFSAGPPQRTSRGYVFLKPDVTKETQC